MRQFRPAFLVAALIFSGTVRIRAEQETTPSSSTYTPLLSTCETTEPSPTALSLEVPPDLAATERQIRSRLQANPSDAKLQFDLATVFEIAGDFPAALVGYQEALKLDRSCEDCLVGLVALLTHCKQDADAVGVTEEFLSRTPESVRATHQLALLYLTKEKYPEALRAAKRSLQLDQNSATGYQFRAMAHLGLEQTDEAAEYFEMALEHDESLADAHVQLGLIYAGRPETVDSAALHLRKAVELGIVHPEIHKDLGRMLLNQGQYKDAIAHLHKALDMTAGYPEPYSLLSRAYRKMGQDAYAEAAMERFRTLEASEKNREVASQAETHYGMGVGFLEQGKGLEARGALLKAIAEDPGMDPAYFLLAQISLMASRQEEAVEWARKAIAVNPVRPRYHQLLGENLPVAQASAAIEAVKEAIRLDTSEAEFYNSLGNVLFADNRNESAVKAYREAVRQDQENAIFHLNLSSVLKRLGDDEGSKRERAIYFRLSARPGN